MQVLIREKHWDDVKAFIVRVLKTLRNNDNFPVHEEDVEAFGYFFHVILSYLKDNSELSEFLQLQVASLQSAKNMLNIVDTLELNVAYDISNGLFYCAPNLVKQVLTDILTISPANWPTISLSHGLFNLLKILVGFKMFEEVVQFSVKALSLAEKLCNFEEFESGGKIVYLISILETILWKLKEYEVCIQICRSLPPLCKFRTRWNDPDHIV